MFNPHKELRDKHAFLSPSNYHWLKYNPEKLRSVYLSQLKKEEGTKLHALAKDLITLGVMLPNTNETLNMYVNDCIVMRMTPEQPLFYSWNCYGTADALGYDEMQTLRISDLKTGLTPASMNQLKIYAALFFLEYGTVYDVKPDMIDIELRIYQRNEVKEELAESTEIQDIMRHIIACDQLINEIGGPRILWNSEYSDQ